MANNGFLNGAGYCVGEVEYLAFTYCPSVQASFRFARVQFGPTSPLSYSCVSSTNTLLSVPVSLTPNCEIEGPPLNSTQQIEAVNAIFPAILVALCVIWGVKQLYNTLISNPRAE